MKICLETAAIWEPHFKTDILKIWGTQSSGGSEDGEYEVTNSNNICASVTVNNRPIG
jgi:hypothetical protein